MGLAIGREGHNVNEVRKLDGILSVEFEDYNQMFRVRAKVSEIVCVNGNCFPINASRRV